jgi:pullulanase-type alpha-1,6-glucosidase
MSVRPRRRPAAWLATVLVAALMVAVPAAADHTPEPSRVTLMGDLMEELGCPGDWDEGCEATDMTLTDDGVWELTGTVPAGTYQYKVRLNGSWDENYGADGAANGDNIPLVLLADAELRFTYDHDSHRIAVAPAAPAEPAGDADRTLAGDSLREDLTRERFYFVMADRFANGDPSNDTGGFAVPDGTPADEGKFFHGYDPTDTAYFHGGDIQGLIDHLDYIEGLGTTALWLTPSFKNKPVQGVGDTRSAGYHGYWITDYTVIDPHLGTNDDMRALVDAAHDRGIKVFFDIITNHSADVITYDEAEYTADGNLPYVSTADEPYRAADGTPFDDRDYAGTGDFPEVDLDSFPYTPIVPAGEADLKVPAWLNDPRYYHNRGVSTFSGESDTYGDFPSGPFSSLDDLWTEHPDVVEGMIDIYNAWVGDVGIDGFRIDTVKHVNIEFWQQFSPGVLAFADSIGNDDFFMFGEVYDSNPAFVSRYTTEGTLQAAVDFGFQASATGFARGAPTTDLRDFFFSDDWYTDHDSNVYSLPTFLGNHDMGRIGSFLATSDADDAELLARDQVAHALMYLSRGQPVVYYGDEQGFKAPPDVPGGVGDQRAREDMFPTEVDLYASYDPIGTDATPADANFDPTHPLYVTIAELAALVDEHPALADGAQVHRFASDAAGIYAFSRVDPDDQREYVVAINNDDQDHAATFDTFTGKARMDLLWGPDGAADSIRTDDEGRVTVEVPGLSAVVYEANRKLGNDKSTPQPFFSTVGPGDVVGDRAEIGVSVPGDAFTQVTFAWRPVGGDEWTVLGTDDNAPYRVFHDVSDLPFDAMVEYRAIAVDATDDLGVAQTWAVVGEPADDTGGGGGPVTQPDRVTTPGTFQDEVGCGSEWDPSCPDIDLTLDAEDLVWKKTFEGDQLIPAAQYAYKVAINGTWDENYGAGAVQNGPNITLDADGSPITFYYSHATNWVTNSIETPHIYVAPGNFQSELGCPGDWQPDCMRSWLQDPDGDGTWTFRTEQLPPGSYESKVAQDFAWGNGNWGVGGVSDGPNLAWTVGEDEGVEFRFIPPDPSEAGQTAALVEVVTYPAEGAGGDGLGAPDPSVLAAQWLTRDTIAWDLPSGRDGWTYRLHHSPDGGLGVDAEGVTGGDSIPLSAGLDDLPPELAEQYPHLGTYATLVLDRKDARDVEELLTQQVVVAAYDDLGRLVHANGVQLPGVLDDVYAGAVERDLGVTWSGRSPQVALWAPTATDVDLLVWQEGGAPERITMRRDADGVWVTRGTPKWAGAEYAFDVTVYVPSLDEVVTNRVTDPYSHALTADSERSVVVDLADPALAPDGWEDVVAPALAQPEDTTVYELHVRDFSATDETVPADWRGTYKAFTVADSDGVAHLTALADAGMNTLHLLPTYDLGSVPEVDPATPDCDLASYGPAATEQQACVGAVRADDAFNWGYDPYHYTTPEGSYATDPDGPARTLEYREMVQAVTGMGLRVVNDVVYNHTYGAGQDDKSVLDKVVPGYYHRLDDTGAIATSTCCFNTATEHAMMEKLMVDSVVTWAREYKVSGFRFDLMGHHSLDNMLAVRAALDELTMADDGVDGASIYLYGEGWNFGEVADNARFTQASQFNLAGTGIGSFNDRMRDAVHGGSPFDDDPRAQGFGSGLFTDPNGAAINGDAAAQEARLLYLQDRIKVGLAGNLRDYTFEDRNGAMTTGIDLDGTGYAADPSETVNYVDAHDNETLHDLFTFKLPADLSLADRGRMNTLAQATTALSQGVSFWHAGTDLLRSKSLDRDSYDSGDWFNRIDWAGEDNTFGSGLPGAWRNEDKWPYMEPLLARADELTPTPEVMAATRERALDLLRLRMSSPLFRLGDADAIQDRVSFPDGGPDQARGVITMHVDDRSGDDLDPAIEELVVVFNATPTEATVAVDGATGPFELHPVQAAGSDDVVRAATAAGTDLTVPARTVAVFVAPQG